MISNSRIISAARFTLRPIPGFDGYAATSEGRIVKLFDGDRLALLSEHFRFGLRVAIVRPDGSESTAPVAKLVALAFYPGGPGEVIFADGNQRNCHPDNVSWKEGTTPVDPSTIADMRKTAVPGIFVTAEGATYSTRSSHGDGLLRRLNHDIGSSRLYLQIKTVGEDGKILFMGIHRLVCEAFNGPPPAGKPNACHRNDSKHDNRAENLYWGSDLDNHKDAVRNKKFIPYGSEGKKGTVHIGEAAGRAVFSETSVRAIRARNAAGETYATLARELGVHPNSVRLICLRKTWAHVA